MTAIPEFKTARLALRSYRKADIDQLFRIVSDRDVIRYMPRTDPWPLEVVERMVAMQQDHWDQHGFGWWAVEHLRTEEFIGWCGLCYLEETQETEVKYLFAQPFWGAGLATESAIFSVNFALQVVKLQQLIGLVHPDNIASRRVLEKCGLKYSGLSEYFGMVLRKYLIKNTG